MRLLLTTTSFQDTPGAHHEVLAASGFEVVKARGPLDEAKMLALVGEGGGFDGLLNGDDAITAKVIDAALPRLKVIAKYGIGLDSIDVAHATAKRIPVLFTPGVNETTVAEHTLGLMVALAKHFYPQMRAAKSGQWTRTTGRELAGKHLGIIGLGRIGKQVALRARAFGMTVSAFSDHWDDTFAAANEVSRAASLTDLLAASDVVSLHLSLSAETRGLIGRDAIAAMRPGAMLINTARGALVDEAAIADACRAGELWGYATDVLAAEPMRAPHPFQELDNVIITPHVASRTSESVERQGLRAAKNVVNFLKGDPDFVQANRFDP